MKKRAFLILLITTTLLIPQVSFLKKQKKVSKKSPAQLKEEIGYELEDVLTLSSDLIASLSNMQKLIVSKMHTLVAPEKSDFFSDAKVKELQDYLDKLEGVHREFKKIEQNIKKECDDLSK
ncbi:MAG: hypothetical protein ACJAZS_000690, partial [Alteromonas naphthalenivorans]